MKHVRPSRRELLRIGAAMGGGLVAGREALALEATPRKLGEPLGPYSERSPFEKAVRWTRESKTPETGSSFTPLQESVGILTPSALHYERHHAGVPTIDPARHRLVVHGMVDRPLSLSMAEHPAAAVNHAHPRPRVRRQQWQRVGGAAGADVQRSHGL